MNNLLEVLTGWLKTKSMYRGKLNKNCKKTKQKVLWVLPKTKTKRDFLVSMGLTLQSGIRHLQKEGTLKIRSQGVAFENACPLYFPCFLVIPGSGKHTKKCEKKSHRLNNALVAWHSWNKWPPQLCLRQVLISVASSPYTNMARIMGHGQMICECHSQQGVRPSSPSQIKVHSTLWLHQIPTVAVNK